MSKLSEAELIDLVESRYFASVGGERLDGTVECFAPDATLRMETVKVEHVGHAAIRRMFGDFMNSTKIVYRGGYTHVVDFERQCIASQFVARNDYDDAMDSLIALNRALG